MFESFRMIQSLFILFKYRKKQKLENNNYKLKELMGIFNIKNGLDIPITGIPEQKISKGRNVSRVALLGDDYVSMKPTLEVAEGDQVKLGQLLFTDKKCPAIKYTAPGAGKVVAINRGEKRKFLSLVIELDDNEEQIDFKSYSEVEIKDLKRETVKEQLLESGQWTNLRVRPLSKVADPETVPHSIFINAMDSNPLAPSIPTIIKEKEAEFKVGLRLISKLTDGNIYLCKEKGTEVPSIDEDRLSVEEFFGPHPSGLAGTHIHFLDPVGPKKFVWYINAEDVAAIGYLFLNGKVDTDKIVAIGGPQAKNPRLIKTRQGAFLDDLLIDELESGNNRVISGSVLSGRKADEEESFLGKFHRSISILKESEDREFLGWLNPFVNKFSLKNVLFTSLSRGKKFDFDTNQNGSLRAIVPSGNYEKVMPLDIMPTFLFRSLAVDDLDEAEQLGMLELDEEDLGLCTFVCPSKINYGEELRRNLTLMEKEGL